VEKAFDVKVKSVNVMIMKGKTRGGRRFGRKLTKSPDWKKAVVTLLPGNHIELFEGV
jgi:large subunit ribosomal protein L23